MSSIQQSEHLKDFLDTWRDRGDEKRDCQTFWIELLLKVLDIPDATSRIQFEKPVQLCNQSYIDAYIPETRVLIEQKGAKADLTKPSRQSDGSMLTPFEQAKRYADALAFTEKPRWIVTCNFHDFYLYDLEAPGAPPQIVTLEDLGKNPHYLDIIVRTTAEIRQKELEVSVAAGNIVGRLYDLLHAHYRDPDSKISQKALNMLCVRLIFLLYSEDAGIFEKDQFYNYMVQYKPNQMRTALIKLFEVLDTKLENRDPYLANDDPVLAAFPYVDGGLFSDMSVEIPPFDDEIADYLLKEASLGFDWSPISPTIFGAVFESTLNPDTRRASGMHYTSIENIHKLIDPLFCDSLTQELDKLLELKTSKTRNDRLNAYCDKLASLNFLDPACGSGNFLTETYLSIRRLENRALKAIHAGQMLLNLEGIIKVSIGQFYGIEINDFAVSVAQTALWIAESQMMRETEKIVQKDLEFLPIKSYTNIVEANALRMDWEKELHARTKDNHTHFDYIIGNPPYVGKSYQSHVQKEDMSIIFEGVKNYGNLDYISCWFKKSADLIQNTNTEVAFVSTNSICQGIAVPPLWNYLFSKGIVINYAYQTFIWDSESNQKAHVHCVIISFSFNPRKEKILYNSKSEPKLATNINAYLVNGENVIVKDRAKPFQNMPEMKVGSCPTDGGNLILQDSEYAQFVHNEPAAKAFIHPYMGSEELINNTKRWCLWLKDCTPSQLKQMPLVMNRLKKVQEFRNNSKKEQTRRRAATPSLFAEDRYVDAPAILIPMLSSSHRQYVPIAFIDALTIPSNLASFISNCPIYVFAIISSNVCMAWMKVVGSKMKSDYRFSASLVYNTFPWPQPTDTQKAKIESTAQAILDARSLYPGCSLADLYDPLTMPPELRHAHEDNDRAVMEAYGYGKDMIESDMVADLFRRYEKLAYAADCKASPDHAAANTSNHAKKPTVASSRSKKNANPMHRVLTAENLANLQSLAEQALATPEICRVCAEQIQAIQHTLPAPASEYAADLAEAVAAGEKRWAQSLLTKLKAML